MSEALKIYEIMWMEYKAVNTVVPLPDHSGNYTVLDLYSGFPYQNGNCEKVKGTILLEKWVLEKNGTFSRKRIYIPQKFQMIFRSALLKQEL
jgi:hypothetical protein